MYFSIDAVKEVEVFSRDITHNLGTMAVVADVYNCLWTPSELGIKEAKDMIPYLEKGLKYMKDEREYLETFNPSNGWGDYTVLLDFVRLTLKACRDYPEGRIHVHR
jgi:hypothetical protein